MKNRSMQKIGLLAAATALTALLFTGCAQTDVVLKYGRESFAQIVREFPDFVTDNTEKDHYYYLTVDGETTLIISHDYDLTGTRDLMIQTPLQPFADAGLDASKLGSGYKAEGDMLYLIADYGSGTGMKDSVAGSLFESAEFERMALSYHQALDHYGIGISNGKFEFAKDYTNNDKDLVFVIQAEPLNELGVDVQHIEGWTFATLSNEDGSSTDVLLKPYDLDG